MEEGSLLAALSDCSINRTSKDCIKVILEDGDELKKLLTVLFKRDKDKHSEVIDILTKKHFAMCF